MQRYIKSLRFKYTKETKDTKDAKDAKDTKRDDGTSFLNVFEVPGGPKSLPNPSQMGPESCTNRFAAINGDPKRSKVISLNGRQRFLVDFGRFGGPFLELKCVNMRF